MHGDPERLTSQPRAKTVNRIDAGAKSMSRPITLADLHTARAVVGGAMPPTPQYAWPLLCERLGAEVWTKHENHTPTGAFKVRGGLTYLEAMRRERPYVRGLVTATRGNHGQSIAFAARQHGVPVTVYVPHGNSAEKNAAMRGFGATLIEHGDDFQAARGAAWARAAAEGWEMVPSYHRDLVVGVATYAYELFHAVPDLDTLYVPIGQGSGIAACVIVRDLLGLRTKIVGVQSVGAPAFALSFEAGRVVTTESAFSLADGIATRVPDAEPVAIIAGGVERIVLVSDDDVAAAIRAFWTDTHNLAEGAGAAGLAAAMREREANLGRKVGVVLCGGNIDLALFQGWVLG
jgi:threonine dehydratase